MAPKGKRSDAGNFAMPKRKPRVFPLSKKVKVLNLIRHRKINIACSYVHVESGIIRLEEDNRMVIREARS